MALTFKNKYVDRVWLCLIAASFLVWLVVMADRIGWRYLCGLFLVAFLWRRALGD